MNDFILIREAQPDDASAALTALRHVLTEPDHDLPYTLTDFNTNKQHETDFIANMRYNENELMLLAEDMQSGGVVGILMCERTPRQDQKHVVTLEISVIQEYRRRGVGSKLLAEAIRWAERNPIIHRVELLVSVRNEGAIALCKSHGFEIEGRAIHSLQRGHTYQDAFYMGRLVPYKPIASRLDTTPLDE